MKIELPQGSFSIDVRPSDPVMLVGGGRPPDAGWLKRVSRNYPVWAIDRGIDVCRTAAVIPEILIGDADSGDAQSWLWAESLGVPSVRHPVDKDLTDLQLALQELGLRRPGASALLTGGLGRRFDHAYSNVFSLLEADQAGIHAIGLADEAEAVILLAGGQTFQAELAELPTVISLLPLSDTCENVQSQGVHWPLHGTSLNLRHPGGISNRLAEGSRRVSVSLGTGRIGVYFCWKEKGL
jgi:thiamine pyrophosphokinase